MSNSGPILDYLNKKRGSGSAAPTSTAPSQPYAPAPAEQAITPADTLTPTRKKRAKKQARRDNAEEKDDDTATAPTLTDRLTDALGAVPPIIGCSAVAYLLGLSGCTEHISKAMPNEMQLNIGYHLAAGAGLYGGHTKSPNRRAMTIAALALSYTPELIDVARGGDLKQAGTIICAKTIGYGFGYLITNFFW